MGTATLLLKSFSGSGDVALIMGTAKVDSPMVDSMMELERPGVEKKKRWEAKAEAKSAGVASASAGSGSLEEEEVEREEEVWLRDLEVESKVWWWS